MKVIVSFIILYKNMPILIFDEKFKLVFAGNCRKFLEDLILIKAFSDSFFLFSRDKYHFYEFIYMS